MGRKDRDPVPGSDEDYLRRTGMTRSKYLEYMREANKRRNVEETRRSREGRRAFEQAETEREQQRGKTYKSFLRKYGDADEKAEGQSPVSPEPGRVRRWWQGRGSHDRWVGQDTPPSGERATPPDRPRRTGTSLGDLIGISDPTKHEPSNPVSLREQNRKRDERRRRSDPTNPENWGKRREDLADESDRNKAARQREADRRKRESDPSNPENWGKRKGKGGGGQASKGGLGIFSAPSAPEPDDDNGDDDDDGGGLGIFKGAW